MGIPCGPAPGSSPEHIKQFMEEQDKRNQAEFDRWYADECRRARNVGYLVVMMMIGVCVAFVYFIARLMNYG